jgi:hypothetical protein
MSQNQHQSTPLIEFRFVEHEPITEDDAQSALLAWMLPIIRRVATTTTMVESPSSAERSNQAA